jgi:hypothetical protein
MTTIDATPDGIADDVADAPAQLRSALKSARHLLATTADAVHSEMPAGELLTYLTDYRGHLSELVSSGILALASRSPGDLDLDAQQGWAR